MVLTVQKQEYETIFGLTTHLCKNMNMIVLSYLSVKEVYKLKKRYDIDIMV